MFQHIVILIVIIYTLLIKLAKLKHLDYETNINALFFLNNHNF